METRRIPADSRYLKTPDGAVYGPVDSLTLCAWAADARVTPGCQVSRDGRTWRAATDYPELRLHWQASLPDGTTVGPLNLFALWELIQDGSLPRGLPVRHCVTGEEVPLDERLLPVALKESRDLIKVLATQMAGGAAAAAPAPEADALRARLAQAEKDLAENLRLMGETQRLLVARDRQIKTLEERAAAGAVRPAPSATAADAEVLQGRLEQADRNRDVALQQTAVAQHLVEERDRQVRALEQRVEQSEARLTALQRTLEAERASRSGAVLAAGAPDAVKARLAELERDLADAQRERDAAQQAVAEREREVQSLTARLAEGSERQSAAERETENARAEGAAAVRGIGDELARVRGDAATLRDSLDRDTAAWQAERIGLERRCDEAESLARTRAEAAEAAEGRAQATARQLEAERKAAGTLQADWERRLVEAGQAASEAASQALAERRLLEQRLEVAEHAREAMVAERTALQAAVAASEGEKAQAGARITELERAAHEALAERELAGRRLAEVEQAGRDALAREAAARATVEAEAAAGRERCAGQEAALEQMAAASTEAEEGWARERDALQARLAELEQNLAAAHDAAAANDALQARVAELGQTLTAAQDDVAARDARLAEQAAAHMAALVAASQNEAGLRERSSRLERELDQTIRRLNETKGEATALRQSLADERTRSVETAKRLQVELKGVQRDLHALDMVKTVARQIHDDRRPTAAGATIDWLSVGTAPKPAAPPAKEPQDMFAGLDLHDQVGVLHEELKASVSAKELLRFELDKLRTEHENLRRRGEDTERDLGAKVAQLQNEIQSGGAVLHQTMEELEKREGAWRLARKKSEEREKELADRVAALEADIAKQGAEPPVVVQGEWQSPPKGAAPSAAGESVPGEGVVLGSVEAQLQTELHKWDSLNRDKDRKADKTRSWFRWKKP